MGRGGRKLIAQELARWQEAGLITSDQRERIAALYAKPSDPSRRGVLARLPALLIGLAVLLIGVGLILFYAANWRRMSTALKLGQVFSLLVACYGAAYHFLFVRQDHQLIGRALAVLGMLSYGAAIGLIAQVFHISAHPTNGVLLWLAGTVALAATLRERWGNYLALLLALLWSGWELLVFGNPPYLLLASASLVVYLSARVGDRWGVLAAGLMLLGGFYQVNANWLVNARDCLAASSQAFVVLHLPLGVALVALARLNDRTVFAPLMRVAEYLGWLCAWVPFIGLSWPMRLDFRWFAAERNVLPFTLELLVLIGTAGVLVAKLVRQRRPAALLLSCLAAAAALLVLPLGQRTVLLVTMHLGLLGLLFGLLAVGPTVAGGRAARVLAPILTIGTLLAKGFGLFALGLLQRDYFLAYCLGFVILATVVFLLGQLATTVRAGPDGNARTSSRLVDGASALAVFATLYAASFRVPQQRSIFSADAMVITLVALFVALGLVCFVLLAWRGAARLPLTLAGIVFVASALTLAVAGPRVPWHLYALLFNLLLFVSEGTLIYYATRIDSVWLAHAAIAGVVLQVVTRYFDLFWDLLSGSLLFIVTGVLVFGGGYALELLRRRVTAQARASGVGGTP